MKKLETEVHAYLKERGWETQRPGDMAKSLIIEAAELLELFQWSNQTLEETKKDEQLMVKLKKELADVFIYAIDMVVLLDLDMEEIVLEKLNYIKNKYPAELMKKGAKKDMGAGEDAEYWRIKHEHRKSEK